MRVPGADFQYGPGGGTHPESWGPMHAPAASGWLVMVVDLHVQIMITWVAVAYSPFMNSEAMSFQVGC